MRTLLVLLLLSAAPAAATVPIMVAPFGDRAAQKELFNALELELEIEANLVLSDPTVLFEDLMVSDLGKVPPEEIAASLKRAEQVALVRAIFYDEDLEAVIVVLRASDGAIVFAKKVDVDLVIADARGELVTDLMKVLSEIELAQAVPPEKLVELRVIERRGPVDTDPEEKDPEEDPKEDKRLAEPEPAPPPSDDPFGTLRISATWAPHYILTQGCEPSPPNPAPFLCVGTVTPADILALGGGGLRVDYRPLGWLGLQLDAQGAFQQISLVVDEGESPWNPDSIGVRALGVTGAAVLRLRYQSGGFGIFTGLRAGYHLESLSADQHRVQVAPEQNLDVAVVPSATGHMGVLGFALGLSFNGALILHLDLDSLVGLYGESPRMWEERTVLGFGGRARIGVDVKLGGGVFLTLGGSALGIHAQGVGVGTRVNLGLETFSNGHARLFRMHADAGLGWRF